MKKSMSLESILQLLSCVSETKGKGQEWHRKDQ